MKIITYNVNGIRAALGKNFIDFLKETKPDVVCLQEIKANESDIPSFLFEHLGYHCYWFPAQKKGYSGVGILTKIKPEKVSYGCKHPLFDDEGRVISAQINGYEIISAYFPSGTTGDIRQEVKYEFLNHFYNWILDKKSTQLIVCGDYNICHKEIDIHDPKGNKNSSGFLPEERAWMDKWFASGMVDSFRTLNGEIIDTYSWWSYRAGARKNNKGWRIDYISVSENIKSLLKNSNHLTNYIHSDHCGVWIDLKS